MNPDYSNIKIFNKRTITVFLVIILILLWSTVASAFKVVLRDITYYNMLFYSSLFSAISIFIFIVIRKRIKYLHLNRIEILKAAGIGIINPFIYYNVLFKAYDILPAQEAQPLNYTWPIVLAIFSYIFLKDKISVYTIIGIMIAFIGVIVISTGGNILSFSFSNPFGDILAIGSSIIWASYWIINIRNKDNYDIKLFYYFVFGTIYILIQMLVLGKLEMISIRSIMICVYIGAFEMGITFILWINILKRVKNRSSVILITYTIPFLSLVFIQLIVKETIKAYSIFGLTLIISGIIIDYLGKNVFLKRRKQ